jgi:hypothetical protein
LAGRPYTFTAERYTFPYTRMQMELLVRIVAMLTRMIERGGEEVEAMDTRQPFSSPLSSTGERKSRPTRTATRTVDDCGGAGQVRSFAQAWTRKPERIRQPAQAGYARKLASLLRADRARKPGSSKRCRVRVRERERGAIRPSRGCRRFAIDRA